MKQMRVKDKPGLCKLKHNVEKNKNMVRKAAPVTVENKGMIELQIVGEELYRKVQLRKKSIRRTLLSRIF
ncbi:MAG: hypothetical protein A2Y23_12115 [Clostridiales bacterium GWB2_37_7]|nr:MAG: hypothetical protein A2Y23_12115 [Clostridiales bacterium GWB2_37_7]